jgi:hypothetical protein
MSIDTRADPSPARRLIPGAYERNPVTPRQPGSMGGGAFGSTQAAGGSGSMDAATIADRDREGGGGPSQRPRRAGADGTPTRS